MQNRQKEKKRSNKREIKERKMKEMQRKCSAFVILCKWALDVFVRVKLWQGGNKVSDTDRFFFCCLLAGGLSGCQISSSTRVITCFRRFPFCFSCSLKSCCVAVSVSGRPWQTEQHPKRCSPAHAGSLCLWLQQLDFCSTLPREPRLPPPSPGEVNNFLVLPV